MFGDSCICLIYWGKQYIISKISLVKLIADEDSKSHTTLKKA
jgi:hypothetical protein